MSFFTDLSGKKIIVTGASSGIGFATARLLSECNAHVILISRQEEKLRAARERLVFPERHHCYVLDLATEGARISDLLKQISTECGLLHGLFHCAGIESVRPLQILNSKIMDEMLDLTLKSGLLLSKAFCLKGVRDSQIQTSIVFMSSVAAITGQKGMSIYAAARAGLDGAMRALACELASQHIRVNSIISGAVETPMHDRLTANLPEASVQEYRNKHLLGFGTPEDIANAAVFLLSDSAKWITGSALVVDGGYSCV